MNYEDVTIEGNKLTFAKEGMGLDLGAIAKGYIADKMKEFLVSKGVKSATINLGGNVLCIGKKRTTHLFALVFKNPLQTEARPLQFWILKTNPWFPPAFMNVTLKKTGLSTTTF